MRAWSKCAGRSAAGAAIATIAACTAMAVLTLAPSAWPAGSSKPGEDVFWKPTDFVVRAPASIAMLPTVSFDHSAESEREVTVAWAASFSRAGYRWISAVNTRSILHADPIGDSLLTAARAAILRQGEIDSTLAPAICAKLRVQALLGVRIEQWERHSLEINESGKPWTRVHLRAVMVDSTGHAIWTASGSETVEGPNHEVRTERGATGRESSAPASEFSGGEGAAPAFHDVLTRLLTRWSAAFPPRPTPSAPAPSASGSP
jgi:hypothetical protein